MGLLDATAFQRFRDGFAGTLLDAPRCGVRRHRTRLQRDDRPRPARSRTARHRAGRGRGDPLRPEAGLEIAVRAAGHSVAGILTPTGAGGGSAPDEQPSPSTRRPSAGSAAARRWPISTRATEPYALATTGGRVSTTGVGGFVLGGGSGSLDRRWGWPATTWSLPTW